MEMPAIEKRDQPDYTQKYNTSKYKNEEQDMTFIGRGIELQKFDQLWNTSRAQFMILYGRRRVGKTALLAHWIQTRKPRALYWVVTSDTALAQLRSFSQAVYTFGRPNIAIPENVTFGSWDHAWEYVVRLAEQERIAVFIDEFTYLLETTPAIA